jgi:hypothetical protein
MGESRRTCEVMLGRDRENKEIQSEYREKKEFFF